MPFAVEMFLDPASAESVVGRLRGNVLRDIHLSAKQDWAQRKNERHARPFASA
jgi:hypothetical protein